MLSEPTKFNVVHTSFDDWSQLPVSQKQGYESIRLVIDSASHLHYRSSTSCNEKLKLEH